MNGNSEKKWGGGAWLLLIAGFLSIAVVFTVEAHLGYHESLEGLNERLEASPKDASLYLRRGKVHSMHRKWEDASQDFERAQTLNPELKEVEFELADMAYRQGQLPEAFRLCTGFLDDHPKHAEGWVLLAGIHAATNNMDQALTAMDVHLRETPRPVPGRYLQRAGWMETAGRPPAEIIESLEAGIKRLGPLPQLHMNILERHRRANNPTAAIEVLDALETGTGSNPKWMVLRGTLHLEAGNRDAATAAFQKAQAAISALPARRQRVPAFRDLNRQAIEGLKKATQHDSE